jgi:diacylglycerol kinase (ATP)
MRVTLFHNPGAGFEQPSEEELIEAIKQAGYEADYHSTKEEKNINILDKPGKIVAVAGGDGTMGKTLKYLADKDVLIGLLPMGTANNIGKSLNLNRPAFDLIASWPRFKQKSFDIGTAKGPWGEEKFLESVGVGLCTKLITVLDAKEEKQNLEFGSREEELGYILEALDALLKKYNPVECQIEIDGMSYSGRYLLVEVMNINYVGPNLQLAPEANPGDGLFDVVMLGEEKQQLSDYIKSRLQNQEPSLNPPVQRGRHIKITCKDSDAHIDDQIMENSAGKEIEILVSGKKLKFLSA